MKWVIKYLLILVIGILFITSFNFAIDKTFVPKRKVDHKETLQKEYRIVQRLYFERLDQEAYLLYDRHQKWFEVALIVDDKIYKSLPVDRKYLGKEKGKFKDGN